MIEKLSWLHVSDLHFRCSGDGFSQRESCQALLDYLRTADDLPKMSFVVVTGDVAYSGQDAEYEEARPFFLELSELVSVRPQLFFFVPGNHDVDRSVNRLAYVGARTECNCQESVDRLLGSPEVSDMIQRLCRFWRFVKDFTAGQERVPVTQSLAYTSTVSIGSFKVDLLGLNTAWLSGHEDDVRRLVLGERQIGEAREALRQGQSALCLALAHHPVDWLQEWDQSACHKKLLPLVDFFHTGHLHRPNVALGSAPQSPCVLVAAGSAHETKFYRNSFNTIEVDLDSGTCSIRHVEYSPVDGQYAVVRTEPAQVNLRGRIPGGLKDIRAAMAELGADVERFAGYLAGLVAGYFSEVPQVLGGKTVLMAPGVVSQASRVTGRFLALRNRLRLYSEDTPIRERVGVEAERIQAFVRELSEAVSADSEIEGQLQQKSQAIAAEIGGPESKSVRPHAMSLLEDLRASEEWLELEAHSRRYASSKEEALARRAKMCLAEALIRSDEHNKKKEGATLARDLVDAPNAGLDEHLLAASAAEIIEDSLWSRSLADTPLCQDSCRLDGVPSGGSRSEAEP